LFRSIVTSPADTKAGVGLINWGYTTNVNGTVYPILYWSVIAGN
jgi:hypothetical protein